MNHRQPDPSKDLYQSVSDLPIVSPHGHTLPGWFSDNDNFADPAELLIIPDHYVFRLLYSLGVPLEDLGVGVAAADRDPRAIFRLFASHWHHFLGTPSRTWLLHTFRHVFDIDTPLSADTADEIYDRINTLLARDDCRPRALLERFGIEVLSTTDGALDMLEEHAIYNAAGQTTRLVPCFRPDVVLNPALPGFAEQVNSLGALTNENTATVAGYRAALGARRAFFKSRGATATDHAVQKLATHWLDDAQVQRLLDSALQNRISAEEADLFHNHMLIEMARMSVDDGLVMQLHVGCRRSTNAEVRERFGQDVGADMPVTTDWVNGLNELLNQVGNNPDVTLIAFTLDESTYARELAPLAGHWPALRLGPPWWFHDSPNGIARYLDRVVETAGYYKLAGFNDDTRALMSIPARHDMWRQVIAKHLGQQVVAGRFDRHDAETIAHWLARGAAHDAYRLIPA